MKHLNPILYKFLFTTAIIAFFGMTLAGFRFAQALYLSIIITLLLYVVGDLLILPAFGNWVATAVDFGTATMALWFLPAFTMMPDMDFLTSLLAGAAIGVAEYFFHPYLQKEILPGSPMKTKNES